MRWGKIQGNPAEEACPCQLHCWAEEAFLAHCISVDRCYPCLDRCTWTGHYNCYFEAAHLVEEGNLSSFEGAAEAVGDTVLVLVVGEGHPDASVALRPLVHLEV